MEAWSVSTLRRRVAPAVLLAGLAGSLAFVLRSRPTETEITLRLEGDRTEVRVVECAIEKAPDPDPLAGAIFRVSPPGPALRMTTRLAPGDYDAVIGLELASGERPSVRRPVRLDGHPVTIRVPIGAP